MNIVKTICPACEASLEFPTDAASVVCSRCGATHLVKDHNGTISLETVRGGPVDRNAQTQKRYRADREPAPVDEANLVELDELIAQIETDIEAIRAREQSGPLQLGCAVFGVFGLVLLVIVVFMLVARGLVGGWLFYLALAVVTLIGISRVRAKLKGQTPSSELRADRRRLEQALFELEQDRSRMLGQ